MALLVQLHLFLLFGGVGVAGTWGWVCGGGCQARCWVLRDRTGSGVVFLGGPCLVCKLLVVSVCVVDAVGGCGRVGVVSLVC